MKKLFSKIKSKVNAFVSKLQCLFFRTQTAIANPTGEGFVDSGVKILIAVVIGALLLAGLYALFNTTILPTLTTKIKALFNYAG